MPLCQKYKLKITSIFSVSDSTTCWGRTPGWSAGLCLQSVPEIQVFKLNAIVLKKLHVNCLLTAAGCKCICAEPHVNLLCHCDTKMADKFVCCSLFLIQSVQWSLYFERWAEHCIDDIGNQLFFFLYTVEIWLEEL